MSNFDFLEDYDRSAFLCAKSMEDTLYDAPVSALAFGGRFIESIRNALYQKHYRKMKSYNKNLSKDADGTDITGDSFKREDLTKHISNLYHAKLIRANDSSKIINAYNIRHNIHLNNIEDIESDKRAAKKLYKEVFEIGLWFCKYLDPGFNDDIEFKYPEKKEEKKHVFDVDIVKIFDECVICGKKNTSSNRNICPDCKRKIRIGWDLEDLLGIIEGNTFTEEFLKKNSYDKYEIDYLIHFLREFDLRSREIKDEFYLKDQDVLYDFIEEIKSYDTIEKILIAFYNGLIDINDIDCSEDSFYQKGKEGNQTYSKFYHLIVDKKINNYINFKTKNHRYALDESGISVDEISEWYSNKLKEIRKSKYLKEVDNPSNQLSEKIKEIEKSKYLKEVNAPFNQLSEILMECWIESRENKEPKDQIMEKLNLNKEITDFWFNESLKITSNYPFVKEFIYKNREIEMRLFVNGISQGLNVEKAIEYADTTPKFIETYFNLENEEKLKRDWRLTNQEKNEQYYNSFKNVYFYKKTKEFLQNLKGHTIDFALEKSNLDSINFKKWYNAGEKEFLKDNSDLNSDFYKFYINTTEILMNNWLNERNKGFNKKESCENIGISCETLEKWFKLKNIEDNNVKYNVFNEFFKNNDKILMELLIESIENGKTNVQSVKELDISLSDIDNFYKLGKEGREEYINFYDKYEKTYLSKRREDFIELVLEKEDFNKAIKSSELTLAEIDHAYNLGKNGDPEFVDFYEKLLEQKVLLYASLASMNQKRAMKKAHITKEEIEENSYKIESVGLINRMCCVLMQSMMGKKLSKVSKRCSVSEGTILNWFEKGKELIEKNDFDYISFDDIGEGEDDDLFQLFVPTNPKETEEDFDYAYMRFYNFYYESVVQFKCEMVADALGNEDFLKFAMKELSISRKELNLWKKLGLIREPNYRLYDLEYEE